MIRPIFSNSQFFPSLTPAPRPPWRRFYRAALGCHQGHCHQTQSPAPPMAEGTGWPWSTNRSMAAKSPAVTQWWHPHLGKKYYIYIYINIIYIYIKYTIYIYEIYYVIYIYICWYMLICWDWQIAISTIRATGPAERSGPSRPRGRMALLNRSQQKSSTVRVIDLGLLYPGVNFIS